jgi:CoA:oxalate CoA-transferase
MNMENGPLNGLLVLDLTNVLAGPFCTYQLGMLGAEVLKIENPKRGDLSRQLGASVAASARGMGSSFVAVNAGKQSITLNLKHPGGKAVLERLVKQADVLVENFRPGVMERLGLSYSELALIKPSLIYCSISGFGRNGPLGDRPAYDQIIQGVSGVMSITGDAKTAPFRVGFPICDTTGGLTAAFAIAAALVGVKAGGPGRFIDVSMLEATLATMGWVVSNYLNAGIEPEPMGNENYNASPSGTFRTSDGFINIAANEDKHYASLCQLLERPDLKSDSRFSDRHLRKTHRAELHEQIETVLVKRSAVEWEKMLIAAGVPAGRIFKLAEIMEHEQIRGRRFAMEIDTPDGPQRLTRSGFRFLDEDPGPKTPAPLLSEHTVKWLSRLGYDERAIEHLRQEGAI